MSSSTLSKIIPVVFSTDNNYVPYCGVAISSLIQNANDNFKYNIYVLYDVLSYMNIKRLEGLSGNNINVCCLCIHDHIEKLKVSEYNHLTIASAYRLIIPDVLPDYDKVIYLDSDIIVNKDVSILFNLEIGDNILGAIPGYFVNDKENFMYKHITHILQIAPDAFFNAGILLINLVEFKKNHIKDQCFKLLAERTDLYFMDQCALNIVCNGKVSMLPQEWNYEWYFLFSKETECNEIMDDPAIIHYDGIGKPWDNPGMILAEIFWMYARRSIFYEEIIKNLQIKSTQSVCEVLGLAGRFKNIAVYGAGNIGQTYVEKLASLNICKIVLWVDKNYSNIKGTRIPVEGIDKIYETDFDHIIIALGNPIVVKDVEEMLLTNGIPTEKIVKIK